MNKAYELHDLFPFIDLALFSDLDPTSTLQDLFPKGLWYSTDIQVVKESLTKAKILFIHPDGIEYWTKILCDLKPHSIRLVIFAGSDYTLGHQHLDSLLLTFPTTFFWVQNWFGFHERVQFLPIGVNGSRRPQKSRYKPFCISFFLTYADYPHREEFYRFVESTPAVQRFCLPRLGFDDYCEAISECWFTLCPMGGGYDTLRFWESLMMGTIPIVKKHPFYEVIRLYYPNLPFVLVDSWEDLLSILPSLTEEYYDSLWKQADISCSKRDYWINSLQELSDSCGK